MKFNNWTVFVILVGVLILGNKLRTYSYSTVPHPGETADEYSFGWLGISLIKDRYPVAWSGLGAYESHDYQKINVDGIYDADPNRPAFSIDKPWFDHPPLFGLLTGGYAFIKGVRSFEEASVIILRRPMLKMALVTTLLLYWLGTRLYGKTVGLGAALLYSVIPTTVISSRLALAENGYIPLFLGAVILADYYFEKKCDVYWVGACALAGLAILFKLSGVSVVICLILLALLYGKREKKKLVALALGIAGSAVLAFCVYGAYFGWDTFVGVLKANAGRFYGAGSEILFSAIVSPKMTTTKYLTDGWIVLGWVAALLLSLDEWRRERGGAILTIALVSYMVTFVLFGSEPYGWYRFPFYPFLMIAVARIFEKLFKRPNVFLFTALALMPFGTIVHRLIGVEGFQNYVDGLRVLMIFVLGLFGLSIIKEKETILFQRLYMLGSMIFLVWISARLVFFYTYETWFFVT